MAKKGYTASPQHGVPGHCMLAQVFGPDGKSVLYVESTLKASTATSIANICADALNRSMPPKDDLPDDYEVN